MVQGDTLPKTIAMNLRLPKAVWDKLDALAKSTRRSKSCLTAEAIAAYVVGNAWQVALSNGQNPTALILTR